MLCHLQSISSGLRIIFKETKKVALKLQQAVQYHPLNVKYCKTSLLSQLHLLSESIEQSSETSLLFPVYNFTATFLDGCRQMAMLPVGKHISWLGHWFTVL